MWKPRWWRQAKGSVARAPRVKVELPLHFRQTDGFGWHMGRTQNVSRTGVLFESERAVEVGKTVEMFFAPPAEVWGGTPGTIYGRGKIVRTSPPISSTRQPTAAAKILNYYPGRTPQDW